MLHCDAETLALVALGEPLADDERHHLLVCARCQAELDQNRAVVAAGRSVTPEDQPADPPAEVWHAIADELHLGADIDPFVPQESPSVVSLDQHRTRAARSRSRSAWLAAAATVAGIVIGALGATTMSGPAPGSLVASSQLSAVPVSAGGVELSGSAVTGTARVVDTDAQDYAEVDATGLPPIDGYYEVWLIKSDLSGMISLGALTSGSKGKFVIPAGTDLKVYTIVDVSVEPLNGDPTHSKRSILRGTLEV